MGSLQQVGIIHPALTFRTVPVVVPSERVLATYEVLVRPLYDCIVANAKESSSLAQTRDFLLPKLIPAKYSSVKLKTNWRP